MLQENNNDYLPFGSFSINAKENILSCFVNRTSSSLRYDHFGVTQQI